MGLEAHEAHRPMLTPRQIELIQDSFATATKAPEEVIENLFWRLFALDPGLRYLFPEDLTDLHRRFGFMLGFLIHRLDRWDEIAPRLRNLGVRHISYGVQARHYETFGQALMETLNDVLLDADSECIAAWNFLYERVSSTMIAAECEEFTVGASSDHMRAR